MPDHLLVWGRLDLLLATSFVSTAFLTTARARGSLCLWISVNDIYWWYRWVLLAQIPMVLLLGQMGKRVMLRRRHSITGKNRSKRILGISKSSINVRRMHRIIRANAFPLLSSPLPLVEPPKGSSPLLSLSVERFSFLFNLLIWWGADGRAPKGPLQFT